MSPQGGLFVAAAPQGRCCAKAVNNRDRNRTRAQMARRRAQIEASGARYLQQLRHRRPAGALRCARDQDHRAEGEKIAKWGGDAAPPGIEARMLATPDKQISLTDPNARSMATSGRGSGVVGYNVQAAVDIEHHLIVAHAQISVRT